MQMSLPLKPDQPMRQEATLPNRRDVSQSKSTMPACTLVGREFFSLFVFLGHVAQNSIRPGPYLNTKRLVFAWIRQVSLVRKRYCHSLSNTVTKQPPRARPKSPSSRLIWICFNYVGAGPSRA